MTYFMSTKAKADQCRRCRGRVLAALDEGLAVRVDAEPLPDREAEIAALLAGLWTYVHTEYGDLIHRDACRIAGGSIQGTVHAEHKCEKRRS
jgi:hypothetical protein